MQEVNRHIIGNWKMYGDRASARALASAVASGGRPGERVEVVLCPPFVLMDEVRQAIADSSLKMGAQDCHAEKEGAYTGSIGAPMLKDAGCSHVIVGHSERRQYQHETNEEVRKKAQAAMQAGLVPVICIGEMLEEREAGRAEAVVERQIRESVPSGNFLLAYEPVWAIGSGKIPTLADIEAMHAHIMAVAAAHTGLPHGRIHVLYGGSVKAANAAEILKTKGVSGVLVGGASLKAEEFCEIVTGD